MLALGISGSLRRGSHSTALLRAAARAAPAGLEVVRFEGLTDVPPYDEDRDGEPPPGAVRRLREAIASADAVVISTPEYNLSIPGQLKNALDWASRPYPANALRRKPVAVIGASRGVFGAAWAHAELRKVLATIGARVIDRELPVAKVHEAFGADGLLLDPGYCARLAEIMRLLAEQSRPGPFDLAA